MKVTIYFQAASMFKFLKDITSGCKLPPVEYELKFENNNTLIYEHKPASDNQYSTKKSKVSCVVLPNYWNTVNPDPFYLTIAQVNILTEVMRPVDEQPVYAEIDTHKNKFTIINMVI